MKPYKETVFKSLLDSTEMASVAELLPTSPFLRFDLVLFSQFTVKLNINEPL